MWVDTSGESKWAEFHDSEKKKKKGKKRRKQQQQ
jgi:hypothetical protein